MEIKNIKYKIKYTLVFGVLFWSIVKKQFRNIHTI